MTKEFDCVIVGSGIAGLFTALKLAEFRPDFSIAVLSKGRSITTNSSLAQGGIAAVIGNDGDTFESHIHDTMESGRGYSNRRTVELVVKSAPARIEDLLSYGVPFDKNNTGDLDAVLEGGHSSARVLHVKDETGLAITKSLLNQAEGRAQIAFFEEHFVTDLLFSDQNSVGGLLCIDTRQMKSQMFKAKQVVLATGGSGQLFVHTTNELIATGDGIALASKAGALLANLSSIQYHPTVLNKLGEERQLLLSEALRGHGAYVVNTENERFLFNYDKRGELATRDIVSSGILSEIKAKDTEVFLDCRHFKKGEFQQHFPAIYRELIKRDLNPEYDRIPIFPAVHYQCGGIRVNECGQTSVEGLFAVGECAETGLHGLNRLASNSLLEAVVFGHECAHYIANTIDEIAIYPIPEKDVIVCSGIFKDECLSWQKRIKAVMSETIIPFPVLENTSVGLKKLRIIEVEMNDESTTGITSPEFVQTNLMLASAIEIMKAFLERPNNEKKIYNKKTETSEIQNHER